MVNKEKINPKSFSEYQDSSAPSSGGTYNDGRVEIESNASDTEARTAAMLQNMGVALTDPYLAVDGSYDLVKFPPNSDAPMWKITFTRKGQNYQFSYYAVPHIHKEFMEEIERRHEVYRNEMEKGSEYTGHEVSMPPYIAQMTEATCGYTYGSEPFKEFISKDPNYDFFWVDKRELQRRTGRKG